MGPGFGQGFASSCNVPDFFGTTRAAGVPRAFELRDASGRCPWSLAWRTADAARGRSISPAALICAWAVVFDSGGQ
jgi:hypothetical protein